MYIRNRKELSENPILSGKLRMKKYSQNSFSSIFVIEGKLMTIIHFIYFRIIKILNKNLKQLRCITRFKINWFVRVI